MTVLEKEAHPSPMLSLDKTKEPDQLAAWLNGQEGILSWKLDGLTIVLTYEHGKLLKAVTRGNGEVGEQTTQGFLKMFQDTLHIREHWSFVEKRSYHIQISIR